MDNAYINDLLFCLKNTSFNDGHDSYSEGVLAIKNRIVDAKNNGKKLFFVGNGGSAAIAAHMSTDFMKNANICTCNMLDAPTLTCLGNDYGYEEVFSKQLQHLVASEDILIAISSSGESKNIVKAIEVAKNKNAFVISLTGFKNDNVVNVMADYNVYVPSFEYGKVESIHTIILQQIVDEIMER